MSKPINLNNSFAGEYILSVCEKAVNIANSRQQDVSFEFNGTPVLVHPGEEPDTVQARWDKDREAAAKAYRESAEYAARLKKETEERERKRSAHMKETAHTEAEMRDAKSPYPLTMEQLTEYIESLVKRSHDYGTCCYAMSLAATAAFNFVSSELGVTGFQASCADLDFLRRSRGLKGSFMIIKAEDALYPQYDLPGKLAEAMMDWKPWLKKEATKLLADSPNAHPAVIEHWKKLAQ